MNTAKIRKELAELAKTYKPSKRFWTIEEERILKEFYGKVPIKVLANKLGRTVSSLTNHMKDCNK